MFGSTNLLTSVWYTNHVATKISGSEKPAFPPLGQGVSQSDLVAEAVRAAILSGQLRADEVLVERRLAASLGVSKTPVREALIMLTNTGLVTTMRNRGVVVRRLTKDDARYIYEQRLLLEPWAVGSAVRRSNIEQTNREDFSEAERLWSQSDKRREEPSQELVITNRRFHRALYRRCENHLVVATLDSLQDLTALATMSVFWELSPTWAPENEEHHGILRAALAGDADEAEHLMYTHIERSLKRVPPLVD